MDVNAFFEEYSKILHSGTPDQVGAFLRDALVTAVNEQDNNAQISILNEAAGYFRNISNYTAAIDMGQSALDLLQHIGATGTEAHGTTLLNVATAYRAAGELDKAMALFEESLGVLSRTVGVNDHRLAALHNNISAIHEERGQGPQALEHLRKAVAIMETHPEMVHDTAIVLSNLGMCLLRAEQRAEAVRTLEKAGELFRSSQDSTIPPQYAAMLAGLAEAHFHAGEFELSVARYKEALSLLRMSFGENRDYAVTCMNCADAMEAMGNTEEARTMRNKAQAALDRLAIQHREGSA